MTLVVARGPPNPRGYATALYRVFVMFMTAKMDGMTTLYKRHTSKPPESYEVTQRRKRGVTPKSSNCINISHRDFVLDRLSSLTPNNILGNGISLN